MFRCQFCGSHIFTNESFVEWRDIAGQTACKRAFDGKHQTHQDASFYSFQGVTEPVYESDTHEVLRVGEMRYLDLEGNPIRYTEVLLKMGIIHDIALEMAFKQEKLRMVFNPWFELTEKNNPDGLVFDTLDEALKELFRLSRKGGLVTAGEAVDEVFEQMKTRSNN